MDLKQKKRSIPAPLWQIFLLLGLLSTLFFGLNQLPNEKELLLASEGSVINEFIVSTTDPADPIFAQMGELQPIIPEENLYLLTKNSGIDAQVVISNVMGRSHVSFVEQNFRFKAATLPAGYPNDPLYHSSGEWINGKNDQWPLHMLDIAAAWQLTTGQPQTRIAVIDSGIEAGHPDLTNRVWYSSGEVAVGLDEEGLVDVNQNGILDCMDLLHPINADLALTYTDSDNNGYVDDLCGWDFVNNTNIPWDETGHGTAVSAIIAAQTHNSYGMAGTCPDCKILPLKVLEYDTEEDSAGIGELAHVLQALHYAIGAEVDVINLSIVPEAGAPVASHALENLLQSALDAGIVIVAAAGNDNADVEDNVLASYPGVITVGALNPTNSTKAGFSNYGESLDLLAPGIDIVSATIPLLFYIQDAPSGSKSDPELPAGSEYSVHWQDELFDVHQGTSYSAAFVSGIVGLLRTHRPELAPNHIRYLLQTTADDIYEEGFDSLTGYGIPNALAALTAEISTLAPVATLNDLPNSLTNQPTAQILVGGENVTHYRYQLNNGNWSENAIPVAIRISLSLQDGAQVLRVIGRDAAGNWQVIEDATVFSWKIDTAPPNGITTLKIVEATGDAITLNWKAVTTSDDNSENAQYELKYHTAPLTSVNWENATTFPYPPSPATPGTTQTVHIHNLEQLTPYYFAIVIQDEAQNVSELSNVASAYTQASGNPVLIKSQTGATVYLLEKAVKRPFGSAATFEALRYSWDNLHVIPESMLWKFDTGPVMRYPLSNGMVIKDVNDPTVYLFQDGVRYPFRSPQAFENAGKRWQDILSLDHHSFEGYPFGKPLE